MFGVVDDKLIDGLERLRRQLCCYGGPTCDCKFGASGKGEQTGCPEVRQAIEYLRGQRDQVFVTEKRLEHNATNALRELRHVLAKYDDLAIRGSQEDR